MRSEKRIALVVGNANYYNFAKLKNPINDSRAVRDRLKQKGFEVIYGENLNRRELDKRVNRFNTKLKNSSIGLFYFAGHGVEVEKKNYLIPIGANINSEVDIKYEALIVDKIVDKMRRAKTRLNFIILDACRSNPFKRGAGGLAPMSNAKGTLIAYATDSGDTASDNTRGRHGLFTKYFLETLDKPLNQREFFHQIRKMVYKSSGEKQLPYLNDGTIGDFYFTLPNTLPQLPQKQKESVFSFANKKPTNFYLTINTTPKNTTIKFLNSPIKYYDKIILKKGFYKIEVSKKGYYTKSGSVDLQKDTTITINLDKREKVYKKNVIKSVNNGSKIQKGVVVIDGLWYQMINLLQKNTIGKREEDIVKI